MREPVKGMAESYSFRGDNRSSSIGPPCATRPRQAPNSHSLPQDMTKQAPHLRHYILYSPVTTKPAPSDQSPASRQNPTIHRKGIILAQCTVQPSRLQPSPRYETRQSRCQSKTRPIPSKTETKQGQAKPKKRQTPAQLNKQSMKSLSLDATAPAAARILSGGSPCDQPAAFVLCDPTPRR